MDIRFFKILITGIIFGTCTSIELYETGSQMSHTGPLVLWSSSSVHTFKLEYLWDQAVNRNQILYVASLGWGKAAYPFWTDPIKTGFHGNRKRPLTYNRANDVYTLVRSVFIWSVSNLNVTRTGIKSRMSSNFGQIGLLPLELRAHERLKYFPYGIFIMVSPSQHVHFFIRSLSNLLVTGTGIKSQPSSGTLTDYGISKISWPILIKFICSISGMGEIRLLGF